MSKIAVDFSGWLRIEPSKIRFERIAGDGPQFIDGEQYLALSLDERQDCILADFVACLRDAEDLEYESLDVEVVD